MQVTWLHMNDWLTSFYEPIKPLIPWVLSQATWLWSLFAFVPLSETDKTRWPTPPRELSAKPVVIAAASLMAWIMDAAIFAVPAAILLVVFLHAPLLPADSYSQPNAINLTSNPTAIIGKCFFAALNPFWFTIYEIWSFIGTPGFPYYKLPYGNELRVNIEAAAPLALYAIYLFILHNSPFHGTLGSLVCDRLNQPFSLQGRLEHSSLLFRHLLNSATLGLPKFLTLAKSSGDIAISQQSIEQPLISTIEKCKWFGLALISLLIIGTSAASENVRLTAKISDLCNFDYDGYRNVQIEQKIESCAWRVEALEPFLTPKQKMQTTDLLRLRYY